MWAKSKNRLREVQVSPLLLHTHLASADLVGQGALAEGIVEVGLWRYLQETACSRS
jgi:hypothetical protein